MKLSKNSKIKESEDKEKESGDDMLINNIEIVSKLINLTKDIKEEYITKEK